MSDVTFDMQNNSMEVHQNNVEPWRVTLVDTGEETMTGGRLKRICNYINKEEMFCFTYGDGVGNVDIEKLINFHKKEQRQATLTATRPQGRFGALDIKETQVKAFIEKPEGEGDWINGGFFVLTPQVLERISGDDTIWEHKPLEELAREGELSVYKHTGFWQPMDTLRDRRLLEKLWASGNAPWKIW